MSPAHTAAELIAAIEEVDVAAQVLGRAYQRVEAAHAAVMRAASGSDEKGYYVGVTNALPLAQLRQDVATRLAGLGLVPILGNPSIARHVLSSRADAGAGFIARWRRVLQHVIH